MQVIQAIVQCVPMGREEEGVSNACHTHTHTHRREKTDLIPVLYGGSCQGPPIVGTQLASCSGPSRAFVLNHMRWHLIEMSIEQTAYYFSDMVRKVPSSRMTRHQCTELKPSLFELFAESALNSAVSVPNVVKTK